MPEAPEQINVVDSHGTATAVPADQIADAINRGYRIENSDQAAARLSLGARQERLGGIGGTIAAGAAGVARGATLGLSDVALGAVGLGDELQGLREVNPLASTIGEVGGGLAGAFAAPESLLARTPAGIATGVGARVAGLGEEAGVLVRAGASAGGAAIEGAAQNAGAYISDVALGDRELSADAFMGAMGKGALWGGVAGGALALSAGGLQAARRMFPRQEMTREAVQVAEDGARREVSSAVADGDTLAAAARDKLREIRANRAAQDLDTKVKLDSIAVKRAQEVADANVSTAKAQAERAQVQLEKAKAPGGRRTRKAFDEEATQSEAPVAGGESGATGALGVPATTPTAVAKGATEDATTLLERQLAATKQGIDAGQTLADLGAKRSPGVTLKPTHVEDGLNAEIAKVDPEAARLVKGLDELENGRAAMDEWLAKHKGGSVSKFERGEATRAYAEDMRPKEAGYYSKVPEGEGNALLPRGKRSVWRGTEEERVLADAKTMGKLAPEEQLSADNAVAEMFGRRERQSIGKEIADAKPPVPVDEQVQHAVRGRVDSIDDDIAESAKVISHHEAASADLADALGPAAPSASVARADAFRKAQQGAEGATTDAAARATGDAERAADTISLGGTPPKMRGIGSKIMSGAEDVGSAAEVLRAMGVDVPDPKNIPVIGPVLSAYLKARVMSKAFGRFGGKVAATAESTIASKAAQTKERLLAAVDKMMDAVATGASKAAGKVGGAGAALGHVLFSDGDSKRAKSYSSVAPKGSIAETYLARADEIARALEPGALEKSVRARIKTSDPTILDAIVAAQTRKLEFLDSKLPKPTEAPVPGQMHMPWAPSRAEINQFGRYMEAAEDPAAVMDAAAHDGYVSIEACETLRTVYPKLFAEAQKRILTRAMDQTKPMPYQRRVQLSVMFSMPMDGSQTAEGAAFLQSTYQPPQAAQSPQPQMGTPTVTADVAMSARTDPSM